MAALLSCSSVIANVRFLYGDPTLSARADPRRWVRTVLVHRAKTRGFFLGGSRITFSLLPFHPVAR